MKQAWLMATPARSILGARLRYLFSLSCPYNRMHYPPNGLSLYQDHLVYEDQTVLSSIPHAFWYQPLAILHSLRFTVQ
jgi:hypothetical protein